MLSLDEETGRKALDELINSIKSNQVIELNFRTVSKIRMILESIDIRTQYKAAKSIRDYKRAIFCLEVHLRDKELNKSYNTLISGQSKQIPISKMQKSLDYEDRQELVSCYSKIIPEDYDPKDFKVQDTLFLEYSQRSSTSTPARHYLDLYDAPLDRDRAELKMDECLSNSVLDGFISPKKHKTIQKRLERMSKPLLLIF